MTKKKKQEFIKSQSSEFVLKRFGDRWLKSIGTEKGSYLFTFEEKEALKLNEDKAIELSELIPDCKSIKL